MVFQNVGGSGWLAIVSISLLASPIATSNATTNIFGHTKCHREIPSWGPVQGRSMAVMSLFAPRGWPFVLTLTVTTLAIKGSTITASDMW